jgi:spoIIIJ-associated protein
MPETCEQALQFLQSICKATDLQLSVTADDVAEGCLLNIDGLDAELLLVQGGELLDALQHLLNQVYGRKLPDGHRIVCDVQSFRATREAELRAMALHAAEGVRATGMPFTFGPMTANERRVIHLTLAAGEDLITESIGERAERKLRVSLKSSVK